MTLEELEKALPEIREKASVSYPWLSLKGLKYETINKIHNGGNYKLRSLYRYLDYWPTCCVSMASLQKIFRPSAR